LCAVRAALHFSLKHVLVSLLALCSRLLLHVLPAEDQLMRVLRFTQAAPTAAAAAAAATGTTPTESSSGTTSTAAASAGTTTSSSSSSSSSSNPWQGLLSKLSGVGPVSAVVGVLQQPAVQESAREQLKRELQGGRQAELLL
jgi:hypothetical protein